MPLPSRSKALRFSVFELHLDSGELFKRGASVRLHDKPFRVLASLLERPGAVVTREELRNRLWSADTFVDFDNNLNAAVRKLREALGDSADSPRFIETLPKRGYRFIAPVEPVEPVETVGPVEPAPSQSAEEPSPPLTQVAVDPANTGEASRPVRVARWRHGFALVVFAVAAGLAGLFFAARQRPVATPPEGKILLAVMPFDNLDGDPDRDYFGDGLTEEMIAQLGRLQPERLGVIARISSMRYKGTDKSVQQIGRELSVDYILEGSVRSGRDKIRVTAQLIQVSDQTHLWSETYDRSFEDILEIQAEVAGLVASSLALELLPDEPLAHARASTRNTEAYEHFLRGRSQWNRFNREGYVAAIGHFERALAIDPQFPQAWAGIAEAYNLMAFDGLPPGEAFPKARQAARRALELDPDLAEAHNSIGFVRLYHDWDLEGADAAFRHSVEISPNYAMAYHWWAGALSALHRHDEALDAVTKALSLDPISLSLSSDLGWYYLFANRPQEALDECERTLSLEPNYGWARSCRAEAWLQLGRLDEAIAGFKADAQAGGMPPDQLRALDALAPEAALAEARRLRYEDVRTNDPKGGDPVWAAMTYAAAGDVDGAFALLEQGVGERNPWLVFLCVDPRFDPLADDPRFAQLARRIGLPIN